MRPVVVLRQILRSCFEAAYDDGVNVSILLQVIEDFQLEKPFNE
jgi:hypothetical protein